VVAKSRAYHIGEGGLLSRCIDDREVALHYCTDRRAAFSHKGLQLVGGWEAGSGVGSAGLEDCEVSRLEEFLSFFFAL